MERVFGMFSGRLWDDAIHHIRSHGLKPEEKGCAAWLDLHQCCEDGARRIVDEASLRIQTSGIGLFEI